MGTKAKHFIPEGYTSLTPYLIIRDAARAIEWYTKALGAKEIMRMPMPDGRVGHAELQVGNARLMLGDEVPDQGCHAPQSVGGTPVHIFLYCENVDATFKSAVDSGATPRMPPTDMFWGDRYGKFGDPFGHEWGIATHTTDCTAEEMTKGAEEWSAANAKKASA